MSERPDQARQDALEAFFRNACTRLQAALSGSPLPQRRVLADKLPRAGFFRRDPDHDWALWLAGYQHEIQGLPEFGQACAVLQADAELSSLLKTFTDPPSHEGLLFRLLRTLLERQHGLFFDQQVFGQLYQEMSADFASDEFRTRLLGPLLGFRMDVERLEIEPDLSIVRMSQQDLELHHSWDGAMDGPRSDCAIEMIVRFSKAAYYEQMGKSGNPLELGFARMDQLRNVLRLFQKGTLGIEAVWETLPAWSLQPILPLPGFHQHQWESIQSWGDSPYVFDSVNLGKLTRLWQAYREKGLAKGLKHRALPVACERFIAVYGHRTGEQRLPDLLGVLDSLLRQGPGDSDYQFCLRWAYLLAYDPDHRERIWAALESAHQIKAHLSYGQQQIQIEQDGKLVSLREFNDMLGELVRTALRIFLLSPLSIPKIITRLDSCIVRGKPYLAQS